MADRLAERIEDLRIPPKRVLDVAGHAGQVIGALQDTIGSGGGREWMLYEASEAVRRDEFECEWGLVMIVGMAIGTLIKV